jgi:hypothetical protein
MKIAMATACLYKGRVFLSPMCGGEHFQFQIDEVYPSSLDVGELAKALGDTFAASKFPAIPPNARTQKKPSALINAAGVKTSAALKSAETGSVIRTTEGYQVQRYGPSAFGGETPTIERMLPLESTLEDVAKAFLEILTEKQRQEKPIRKAPPPKA